jgi:hypothetical protein
MISLSLARTRVTRLRLPRSMLFHAPEISISPAPVQLRFGWIQQHGDRRIAHQRSPERRRSTRKTTIQRNCGEGATEGWPTRHALHDWRHSAASELINAGLRGGASAHRSCSAAGSSAHAVRVGGGTVRGGESKQAARAKRGPASKLEHHLERISALPKPRQRAVIDVIEAMLAQQGH